MTGLMIAAPQSGSGKTTVTLGLLRALKRRGVPLAPGKAGPDYIDPAFHSAASGETCLNYDPWAMRSDLLLANASLQSQGGRMLVVEAMMGLFDGAADGSGSAADLAGLLGLPVILVIDCSSMSHSVAALAQGFANFHPDVLMPGVILNRVASPRHEGMLRQALEKARVDVLGALPNDNKLVMPQRHLGLVQAGENAMLETLIDDAAQLMESRIDLDKLLKLARRAHANPAPANIRRLPPPGQKIAVARDVAFAFAYEHMLMGWQRRGAEISFFSPLADEAPAADCDAVILPGGYPELHAGTIAAAARFRSGMSAAIARGVPVYGECGGYMVLGDGLIDADGTRHEMLGALPLVTSFAEPKRHLGYRRLTPVTEFFWAMDLAAHEFHYAATVSEGKADRLFQARDALGADLGRVGLKRGNVAGSFMHVIDRND
ncbi:MAG: cobyrinate a,c-diamide synthase [Hoeflea sp.]|uniref:cobyrinate a,c-diamide synthase n=1 Tax=Hoeflea sp. TaxID=1940281 RepID=UPI001D54BA84|nr:cobyrinate a,c-diamide synthase [Hoeflea sp.]MBU4531085.1 cobyrinate a,c-diamide synthase [Alphaproteobacteria bacterium]MBU4542860.1 cobyrinate a,c-diamide synthase [Alphaproteobacteria bacterium]MBU4552672.1 cobyrinate a,c-diamide synthase [Alphaproteobacteria bacterium]MBV1722977.1 cobyrinate a,c-diamide synthase [Hoeflea sp.]MBV1762888.1 cobyrinate a,c-diamide synthase [Hoeflea sp.]